LAQAYCQAFCIFDPRCNFLVFAEQNCYLGNLNEIQSTVIINDLVGAQLVFGNYGKAKLL